MLCPDWTLFSRYCSSPRFQNAVNNEINATSKFIHRRGCLGFKCRSIVFNCVTKEKVSFLMSLSAGYTVCIHIQRCVRVCVLLKQLCYCAVQFLCCFKIDTCSPEPFPSSRSSFTQWNIRNKENGYGEQPVGTKITPKQSYPNPTKPKRGHFGMCMYVCAHTHKKCTMNFKKKRNNFKQNAKNEIAQKIEKINLIFDVMLLFTSFIEKMLHHQATHLGTTWGWGKTKGRYIWNPQNAQMSIQPPEKKIFFRHLRHT